jgi:hypothetical protein
MNIVEILCIARLQEIDGDSELVCVHDSARPLVSSEDVKKVTPVFHDHRMSNQIVALACSFIGSTKLLSFPAMNLLVTLPCKLQLIFTADLLYVDRLKYCQITGPALTFFALL